MVEHPAESCRVPRVLIQKEMRWVFAMWIMLRSLRVEARC